MRPRLPVYPEFFLSTDRHLSPDLRARALGRDGVLRAESTSPEVQQLDRRDAAQPGEMDGHDCLDDRWALVTEFLVEAQSGGTCTVRVVTSACDSAEPVPCEP